MKNKKRFLILILFLFLTSLLSLKTLKKVNIKDIRVSGSGFLLKDDLVNNSSLKIPTRLIKINTKFLEKELKQNFSLKEISIKKQLFPFGLLVNVTKRTPIAHGEKIFNDEKILGFIDKDGFFIDKQNFDEQKLSELNIEVFGWEEKFKKILSEIFIAQDDYKLEIVKITFSPNGFLTVEEKNLKTILLGFNANLINYQLEIINHLKNEFKKNKFLQKIDNIDLTDPNKPKIKVFKP